MATDSYTEFYCNASTGANINAGSTEGAAVFTHTNGGWVSATGVFTATGADLSGVTVGMFASVYNDGATVAVFIGRITAVDDIADTITVSLTAKSGTAPTTSATGRSIKVGGVWKGPNAAEAFPFGFVDGAMTNAAGDVARCNFKNNATYSVTAAMTHSVASPFVFQGYSSTPGDLGKAQIDGPTTGAAVIVLNCTTACVFRDLIWFGNGATSANPGFRFGNVGLIAERVVVHGMRGSGFASASGNCCYYECEAYNNNLNNSANLSGFAANGGESYVGCRSHDNTGSNTSGFYCGATSHSVHFSHCIADTNGADGFRVNSSSAGLFVLDNCDSYGNTGDGLDINTGAGAARVVAINSNFVANGGYGIGASGSGSEVGSVKNCGFHSNTSGQIQSTAIETAGNITLAAIPYRDAANGDFTLITAEVKRAGRRQFSTNAGGGYTALTGYPPVGAVEPADFGVQRLTNVASIGTY